MKGLAKLLFDFLDIAPARVMASLGMGFIVYGTVMSLINSLVSQAQSAWGQLGGGAMQIASLAGVPDSLGIILGAILARAAIEFSPKLSRLSSQ